MTRVLFLSAERGPAASFAAALLHHDGGTPFSVAAAGPIALPDDPAARRCLGLVGAQLVAPAALATVAAQPFDLSITLCDGDAAT